MGCCPWGIPTLHASWSCTNFLGRPILCCPETFISQQLISQSVSNEKQKEMNNWKHTECSCPLVTWAMTAVQTTAGGCDHQLVSLSLELWGWNICSLIEYVKCTWMLSDRWNEKTLPCVCSLSIKIAQFPLMYFFPVKEMWLLQKKCSNFASH